MSLSISSFTDKRSDDILEDNIQRNNKSSTTVTSPSTNGHNPGRRKSASNLIENGNSAGAPIKSVDRAPFGHLLFSGVRAAAALD